MAFKFENFQAREKENARSARNCTSTATRKPEAEQEKTRAEATN